MEFHTIPLQDMSTTGNRLENKFREVDDPKGRVGAGGHVAYLEDAAGTGGGDHGRTSFRSDGNLVFSDLRGSRVIADVERPPVPAAKIRALHFGKGIPDRRAKHLPSLPVLAEGPREMARIVVPDLPCPLPFRRVGKTGGHARCEEEAGIILAPVRHADGLSVEGMLRRNMRRQEPHGNTIRSGEASESRLTFSSMHRKADGRSPDTRAGSPQHAAPRNMEISFPERRSVS
jgi:hypothetical protein